MTKPELIYDWNITEKVLPSIKKHVGICDETLRDGIQSPSVHDPNIEDKLELITLMEKIGVEIADIGLPGAGARALSDVTAIAKFVANNKCQIKLSCAARTVEADIAPIAQAQQASGIAIEAYCFLGTSPIRQLVENWDINLLKSTMEKAIGFARRQNLAVAFVTEDTTRSDPQTLDILFRHAIRLGAERLVLCDTVGHATPDGVKALVSFTKKIIAETNTKTQIDWHGHNDRGLGVANAIFAAEYGCDRVHGTALGIGERVGNTALDQLICNLVLLNNYHHDVSYLVRYVEKAAQACGVSIPFNYPLCGQDAFRTATGVHASAIIKAQENQDNKLADIIYSGVPAHWFGKSQQIDIGPMSGASNVKSWLRNNNFDAQESVIANLLAFAKTKSYVLPDEEVIAFLKSHHISNSKGLNKT